MVIGGTLYAFAGHSSSPPWVFTKESEYFDETTQTWKLTLASLWPPSAQFSGQGVTSAKMVAYSDTEAYSFGGAGDDFVCTDHVMLIDLSGIPNFLCYANRFN